MVWFLHYVLKNRKKIAKELLMKMPGTALNKALEELEGEYENTNKRRWLVINRTIVRIDDIDFVYLEEVNI